MSVYENFIAAKSQLAAGEGFAPTFMPSFLFDFQSHLVDWSVRTGRGALFADCGMGKTPMSLVWGQNVIERTNKPILIAAPLSVSMQTVEEAHKFGIDAVRCMDGKHSGARIVVTNYERLSKFNPHDFGGVVCDESSIIKNFDGSRKGEITEFMKKAPYRLLTTATAAPNDYIELGTSSEALGYLGYMDMLTRFFKNDEDSLHPAFIGSKWRFKRHAEHDFWRWMASWSRACRKPSDIGFDDAKFVLPPLIETEHKVSSPIPFGQMFPMPAVSLAEQRDDTKATTRARCELAASLVENSRCAVSWAHTNAEADTLQQLIPGSVQIAGKDHDDRKEEVFDAFRKGEITRLITKPKIAALGMNWQHCAHMTYFPTHSFEQYYQAVRRCYRFGQGEPVRVDVITSDAQVGVLENCKRKAVACDEMFARLVEQMNNALNINRMNTFRNQLEKPQWL